MDTLLRCQVERIHRSPTMAVLAVSGGGAQAIMWLLGAPGASRTVLEALVPYAVSALGDFLGYHAEHVVSAKTSRDMARCAYKRARCLAPIGVPVVGIGCTAAIATDRPKKGDHRCLASVWTERAVATYSITFVKGLRNRTAEDEIVSKLVLRALAEASCVKLDLPLSLDEREEIIVTRVDHDDLIGRLLLGHVGTVVIHADGSSAPDEAVRGGILPGSFHPMHKGHEELAETASTMLQADITFELSVVNVDKPPLERSVVQKRLAQFAGKWAVVVTGAPTFYEKARLLPGCAFVIGWDTAMRLVDPKYYGGDRSAMLSALSEIRRLDCRFLVAGRVEGGVFHTLREAPVPSGFEGMFTAIPESVFRCDLSSTELRRTGRNSC